MKLLLRAFFTSVAVLSLFMSGCDLTKDQSPSGDGSKSDARDLVITEVFTISPDKYYAYSWIEIYNPTNRTIRWNDETKPAYGFAVGTDGTILRTLDDGATWNDSLSAAQSNTLNSVAFPNADTGFAVGDKRTVLKIHRNGVVDDLSPQAKAVVPDPTINFNALGVAADVQNRIAYIAGDKGTVLRTVDRGFTWTLPRTSLGTTKNMEGIYVQFPRIFLAGDSGAFYESTNAGTGWTQRIVPEPYRTTNFYGVVFTGDTGWAVGENGAILSAVALASNAGVIWIPETSNVAVTLRGVFVAPYETEFRQRFGWAVGDSGTILKTENNGATWTTVNSGTQTRLNRVTFADSSRGWIFGDQGLILATTDGGLSWNQQRSNTTKNLKGGAILPLNIVVQNFYVLQMYGQRNYVFFDPQTGTLNTDFITRVDTGLLLYTPAFNQNVVQGPGKFVIVSNDSVKFQDHTKLGPGSTEVLNFSLAVDFSAVNGQFNLLKWALLPSSEIRLLKISARIVNQNVSDFNSRVVDVVRFGGYRPTPDDYPNNEPAGFIPEFWSLARYSDDFGDDPQKLNTKNSFFMARDPIPGWYSQERKPK
ncbi:MAG: hypothetical protein HY033_04650 [Ignavibacteriae bacterium]|nr:hypothetical protein [Ignavibacteria bacterium]MBI3364178.1 hypothetical protein [Ignavibacteriota bacterium]